MRKVTSRQRLSQVFLSESASSALRNKARPQPGMSMAVVTLIRGLQKAPERNVRRWMCRGILYRLIKLRLPLRCQIRLSSRRFELLMHSTPASKVSRISFSGRCPAAITTRYANIAPPFAVGSQKIQPVFGRILYLDAAASRTSGSGDVEPTLPMG